MYRIWRRWLSLLTALALALVFCFAACPFAAFADDTGQKVYQDMIYYTITPMHEVTITGARAILTEANIPAELDGCPVTEIERYAFKDCTRLKQVTLPDTIRRIGEFALRTAPGWSAFPSRIRSQTSAGASSRERPGWTTRQRSS